MAKPYGRIYNNNKNVSITPLDIKDLYPVGSIYLTVSDIYPGDYFGGTWEKLYGGYLYASQATISKSDYTGWGTQSHILTIGQIPSHSHGAVSTSGDNEGVNLYPFQMITTNHQRVDYNVIRPSGGGKGHTHNIATVDVFVWKRTA